MGSSGSSPRCASSQMRLIQDLHTKIIDRLVEAGDSWAKTRDGYLLLLMLLVPALR